VPRAILFHQKSFIFMPQQIPSFLAVPHARGVRSLKAQAVVRRPAQSFDPLPKLEWTISRLFRHFSACIPTRVSRCHAGAPLEWWLIGQREHDTLTAPLVPHPFRFPLCAGSARVQAAA